MATVNVVVPVHSKFVDFFVLRGSFQSSVVVISVPLERLCIVTRCSLKCRGSGPSGVKVGSKSSVRGRK